MTWSISPRSEDYLSGRVRTVVTCSIGITGVNLKFQMRIFCGEKNYGRCAELINSRAPAGRDAIL